MEDLLFRCIINIAVYQFHTILISSVHIHLLSIEMENVAKIFKHFIAFFHNYSIIHHDIEMPLKYLWSMI